MDLYGLIRKQITVQARSKHKMTGGAERVAQINWDIIRGRFAKQVLLVFFLPNEVISYVYKVRASVLSL